MVETQENPIDELKAIVLAAREGGEKFALMERLMVAVTAAREAGITDAAGVQLRLLGALRGWSGDAKACERDLKRKRLQVVPDEVPQEPGPKPSEEAIAASRAFLSGTMQDFEPNEPRYSGKRRVEVQPDGTDTLRLAWETLMPDVDESGKLLEDPPIYRQADRLAMVSDGKPVEVGADALRGVLAQRAEWWKWRTDKHGEPELVQCALPPKDYPTIMAAPAVFSRTEIPILEAVMRTPYLGVTGGIRAEPGYHPDNRVLLLPHGLTLTRMELSEAREFLLDWISDFPIVGDAGKAHAIGLALTPLVRRIINGPVPPVLIEAPKPRTGKTLLAQVLAAPSMGWVSVSTLADSEEEKAKALFSTLLKGRAVAILDNLKGKINSATLEAVLTAYPTYEARVLGLSQEIEVLVRIQWILTTNNGEFSEDMIGRLLAIRLDRHCERPDLLDTSTLKHPDIKAYTMENREKLLSALFSLIHCWKDKGRPKAPPKTPHKGTFEAWRDVIGGILDVAGIPGFLSGDGASRAEVDEWRTLMCLWVQKFGAKKALIGELVTLCTEAGILMDALGAGNDQMQRIRLAKAISGRRDQVVDVTKRLISDVFGESGELVEATASRHQEAGDGGRFLGPWRFMGSTRIMGATYYQIARPTA
jgi:hypothetical protein